MATYKVIQDIEAEDKILGPLTLRQFIYAGVAAILIA
ncbi:MAG: PrgI family mobile element protein [Candidatus Saccharimonadales bacterium]